MKKWGIIVFMCLCAIMAAGSSYAVPYTYTDVYDAGHRYMRGSLLGCDDSVTWTFDITRQGFDPANETVVSARVTLNLQDDTDIFCEFADLSVGTNTYLWEVDTGATTFRVASLATLNTNGTLTCTLTALLGDFYFNSAVLTATTQGGPVAPVPEPGSALLFGSGLIAAAVLLRKKVRGRPAAASR